VDERVVSSDVVRGDLRSSHKFVLLPDMAAEELLEPHDDVPITTKHAVVHNGVSVHFTPQVKQSSVSHSPDQ
jgi:hypothetical protein